MLPSTMSAISHRFSFTLYGTPGMVRKRSKTPTPQENENNAPVSPSNTLTVEQGGNGAERPDRASVSSISTLFNQNWDEKGKFLEIFKLSRKKSLRLPQDVTRTGNGTWAYRGTGTPRRGGHLPELKAGFGTLPRNRSEDGEGSSPESGTSSGPTDELSTAFMSLAYAKLLKLRKQKEELTRIYNMLEDLENDFLGSKDSDTTYIERFMEVKVKKDYMLSPGNPETTLEQEDKVKVYGYLGHNSWRIMGPYCKGYCKKNTVVVNPRIKSQNQISDLTIVCNSCNKITVPLIGAVPTSILAIRNVNLNQPG